jgi:hypothetical protein
MVTSAARPSALRAAVLNDVAIEKKTTVPPSAVDRMAPPSQPGTSTHTTVTSFSTAALSAEGLAADVTMLVGNGYLPGHVDLALRLLREHPGVGRLFRARH